MTEPDETTLRLERLIPSPPEMLFALFVEPAQLLRWWAPVPRNPFDEVERRADDAALVEALRQLDPRERSAVHLRYFEDRSFAETAGTLGVSENHARVIVHRALAKLRRTMASAASVRGVEA